MADLNARQHPEFGRLDEFGIPMSRLRFQPRRGGFRRVVIVPTELNRRRMSLRTSTIRRPGPRPLPKELIVQCLCFFRDFFVWNTTVLRLLQILSAYLRGGPWGTRQLRALYELCHFAEEVVDTVVVEAILTWTPESGIRYGVHYEWGHPLGTTLGRPL
ncbi:hypothetical protein R1sor_022552 [Riccia sorocarpa]|uniref:Uncharacterized protein n=1 Tax=Riccia sorocarpa TaxID=122646 RepID=A0ABD3GLP9_9MARC